MIEWTPDLHGFTAKRDGWTITARRPIWPRGRWFIRATRKGQRFTIKSRDLTNRRAGTRCLPG